MEQEGLAEADSPLDLHTKLYKHQKQALTFMLQREEGWALGGHHKDIWKEERDIAGRPRYINTITSRSQYRPPPSFRGGLLIDAPGLGKSLSIIALIAADRRSASFARHGKGANLTTLLVVPKTCERCLITLRLCLLTPLSNSNMARRVAKVSRPSLGLQVEHS